MMLKSEKNKDPSKYIKFGQTKSSEYQIVQSLGKGTYGTVSKCIHIPSGIEVAMKSYFFDVIMLL